MKHIVVLSLAALAGVSLATPALAFNSLGFDPHAVPPGPLSNSTLQPLRQRGVPDAVVRRLDPVEADLAAALRAIDGQGVVRVPLGGGESVDLLVERRPALAQAGRLVAASRDAGGAIVERTLTVPDVAIFAGRTIPAGGTTGDGDARAFLAVGPRGVDGWVERHGRRHVLSSGPHPSRLGGQAVPAIAFEPASLPEGSFSLRGHACAAEEIEGYAGVAWDPASADALVQGDLAPACRTASVAIETDHEFLGLFGGDVESAAAYALLVMGAASEIFSASTGVQFEVVYLRLWETADDPWDQSGAGDQLYQFREHWYANMGDVLRDEAHFLSGRALGGGVAWLPGTCDPYYQYALSGNLGGSFPYPLVDNDWGNWDVMVVTHEAGHNFGAPHTHSMVPPIDNCGNGDCTDANLGTIMSYCHTCPGGMSNIVVEFAPGTAAAILAHLDSPGADCIATGDDAVAYDDHRSIIAGESVVIDVLGNDLSAACADLSLGAFDAEGTAGGAVSLCAGCGPDGRDALTYSAPPGFGGKDTFTYQSVAAASAAEGEVIVEVKPYLAGVEVDVPLAGIEVAYYDLADPYVLPDFSLLAPASQGVVPAVDFPSTGGNFATSGRSELVGAVFEGLLVVPADGLYTLFLESDDGSRMLVHDEVVVSNDGLHGMVEKSGSVPLLAGAHPVRIEFFERFGGAGLIARVQGPGIAKQVVPAAMWRRDGSADLDGDGTVGGSDLGILLAVWGTSSPNADLNQDGVVDSADLGLLLAAWSD